MFQIISSCAWPQPVLGQKICNIYFYGTLLLLLFFEKWCFHFNLIVVIFWGSPARNNLSLQKWVVFILCLGRLQRQIYHRLIKKVICWCFWFRNLNLCVEICYFLWLKSLEKWHFLFKILGDFSASLKSFWWTPSLKILG